MGAPEDTTSTLGTGAGGTVIDESNILVPSFITGAAPASVGKRPRVVIGGTGARATQVLTTGKKYQGQLHVVDVELRKCLAAMLDERRLRLALLEKVIHRMVGRV